MVLFLSSLLLVGIDTDQTVSSSRCQHHFCGMEGETRYGTDSLTEEAIVVSNISISVRVGGFGFGFGLGVI